MVRTKILYAAILAGLAAFYILYIDSLPVMLLVCALLLPVFLKIGLLWLHFRTSADVSCQTSACTTEDSVSVTVTVENQSALFFPSGEARVYVRHDFGTAADKLRIKFPLQDRNQTRLTFFVKPARCGVVRIQLRNVRIFDVFRLFHTNVPDARKEVELLVLPRPVLLPMDGSAPPVNDPESTRFADKPGDDPSELFGIREYQMGDPVSRIHWKLSSHSDKLFLKEFAAPVEKHALLFIAYRAAAAESSSEEADALLTLLYSAAYQLIDSAHPCTIAWLDSRTNAVTQIRPETTGELGETFHRLYDALYSLSSEDAPIHQALGATLFSSATVLTNVPVSPLLGTLEHSLTANQRNLLIVSKSETPLRSDQTDISHIHPDQLTLARLIV